MRFCRMNGLAAALGLVVAACQGVSAQQPYVISDEMSLVERLEHAESRIVELQTKLDERQQPFQVRPAALNYDSMMSRLEALEVAVKDKGKDGKGDWVDTHGQKWKHKWGGRVQMDYWLFPSQDAGSLARNGDLQNYFEFRRLRFFSSGKGYGVFDYKMQIDFEPENVIEDNNGDDVFGDGTSIKDVYFGVNHVPYLGYVRMGHHKVGFSLEELTSSKYISFMERSLPNVFAPGRKVGIQAFNNYQNFYWSYGAYFEAIDDVGLELADDDQGVIFSGRAWWNPVYQNDGRCLVHLGAAGIYVDDQNDSVRFRARPEVHEGPRFVDSGAVVASEYTALGLEAAVVWGSASAQAEFMYVEPEVVGANPEYYGAYIYGSYFLTGEHRAYKQKSGAFDRVKPLENFWIVDSYEGLCVGTGAVEVLARWSYLDLSDGPGGNAGQLNNITFGVNWYWNPYTRMMFNYIRSNQDLVAGNGETDIIGASLRWDF